MLSRFKEQVKALFDLMMESAENIKMFCCQVIPFTNRDASFCMWFSAAESLIDDITMLNAALTVVDQNPLGSAGYGSSFPIDRTFTKSWAETLKYNAVAGK
jgi:argininosuccinate lyase